MEFEWQERVVQEAPDETSLDSFLVFAYRSREYINETVLLLITDQSHQSICNLLMSRTERAEDLN